MNYTKERLNELRNVAGCVDAFGDNVAIALASYFERHEERPVDDREDESGWGPWVVDKTNATIDRIIMAIAKAEGRS